MAMEIEAQPEAVRPRTERIFFLVFILLIVGSIGVTYWKIMVKRDYVIVAQADCDPYEEKCFVHICDPDPAADGEWCMGDPEEDTWFTKNISRMAYNIPDCDPNGEDCTALVCGEGEDNCSYELCDETNVPEGDTCNDPVQYAIDNPAEEEDSECDPEVDDCAASEDVECDPEVEGDCDVEEEVECDPESEDCAVESADCDPATENCAADESAAAGKNLSISDGASTDVSCQSDAGGVCPLGKN
ncbi:MAG: hypothetical protein Q8L11_01095 [Candidatus Moranbacteria bacterium]|nr:hypothetical protein [bacterium]MDP1833515.1 hypothetical protein [Candidatus Moranbacteria bacterium]